MNTQTFCRSTLRSIVWIEANMMIANSFLFKFLLFCIIYHLFSVCLLFLSLRRSVFFSWKCLIWSQARITIMIQMKMVYKYDSKSWALIDFWHSCYCSPLFFSLLIYYVLSIHVQPSNFINRTIANNHIV